MAKSNRSTGTSLTSIAKGSSGKQTANEAAAAISQSLLNNKQFNPDGLNSPTGGTARRGFEQVAKGKCAPVAATGKCVPVSLDLLHFLDELVKKFPVTINCFTNGTHSGNSDHYKGRAIDIGTATGHEGEVLALGKSLGGWSSGESYGGNGHVHLSFRGGQMSDSGAPADFGASSGGSGDGGGGGQGGLDDAEKISKAAAFSAYLELPGLLDVTESLALTGERSLMNDKPLLPFIEQLCQASLRNFQSMPNGNFFAFFPDYFGGLNQRTPYWEIDDIEIIDGQINLSDDALATHVYVVGDILNFDGVNLVDQINTSGVMTIFNAFAADFLNGLPPSAPDTKGEKSKKQQEADQAKYKKSIEGMPNLQDKNAALGFIQKYGARPHFEEAPMVRSPYYEAFLAYQKFMLLWSRQFITTFTTTFMPELFPGGLVAFPKHGIQCYIDEVEHTCSYTEGFTTRVNLSAPSALRDSSGKVVGRANIHSGMIRAKATAVNVKQSSGAPVRISQ